MGRLPRHLEGLRRRQRESKGKRSGNAGKRDGDGEQSSGLGRGGGEREQDDEKEGRPRGGPKGQNPRPPQRPGPPGLPGSPLLPMPPAQMSPVTTMTTETTPSPQSTMPAPTIVLPTSQAPSQTPIQTPSSDPQMQPAPPSSAPPVVPPTTSSTSAVPIPPPSTSLQTQPAAPVSIQPTSTALPPQNTASATLIVAPTPPAVQPSSQISTNPPVVIPTTAVAVPPLPPPPPVSDAPSQTAASPGILEPSTLTTATSLPPASTSPTEPARTSNSAKPTSFPTNTYTAIPAAEKTATPTPEPVLTTRSKIGIGVGVGILGLLLIGFLFFLLRRRKQQRQDSQGERLFSEYDPQAVYFGPESRRREMASAAPVRSLPSILRGAPTTSAFGVPRGGMRGDERPFSFNSSEDGRYERNLAPGLRSHPVGTRNTLEDLGFPFARRLSSSSFSSSSTDRRRGPLGVVGGMSQESLTDPDMPFRTRSPSPTDVDGIGGGGVRRTIEPGESISRVLARGYPSVTPSESISRVAERTPSENFSRLFGRKSTGTNASTSSNSISVAELPPRRSEASGSASLPSWPMPPGGLKNWFDVLRRKEGGPQQQSRWSDSRPSGVGSSIAGGPGPVMVESSSNDSRDELITALPPVVVRNKV